MPLANQIAKRSAVKQLLAEAGASSTARPGDETESGEGEPGETCVCPTCGHEGPADDFTGG